MEGHPPTPHDRPWSLPVTRVDFLRVGLLGLNAWLVVCLVPALFLGLDSLGSAAATLGPLLPLAAGVAWLGSRRELARWCLLAIFPPALGATIALRADLVDRHVFDGPVILVAAASLVAYVAAAAHACARPRSHKESSAHPLTAKDPVVEPRARRWIRRALLATAGVGGFAMVAIAPTSGSHPARSEPWGEAAGDGSVLTVVVASVIAAFALGAVVGPALRAERRRAGTSASRRRHLAVAMIVGTVAGLGWLVLTHLAPAT